MRTIGRDSQSRSKHGKALGALPAVLSIGLVVVAAAQRPPPPPPPPPPFQLQVPPGLPQPPIAPDNRPSVPGVALGNRLFHDVKLSGNNTESCASCHLAPNAFSDPRKVSIGIDGVRGTRNAPSLLNTVYNRQWFWDGRANSLRSQALQPIQNPIEMHQTLAAAVSKLQADNTYRAQFQAAFGPGGVTSDRIGLAIEQYEDTLLSAGSKFDAVQQGRATFTPQEARGRQLFFEPFNPRAGQMGADCARCHGGPLLSNFQFRNNGLDIKPVDPGLADFSNNPADFAKFKTPSLRNIAVSGPYMHDGRFLTLGQVVAHYSNGILPSRTLDPGLAREQGGVHLSPADQAAVVAFLQTLTDKTRF